MNGDRYNDGDAGAMAGPGDLLVEAVPVVNHVQFGMFEQDVYIEEVDTEPDRVFRPTPADAANPLYADAPLFSSAEMHEHDPSGQNAGPFDKGDALGFTLAEWHRRGHRLPGRAGRWKREHVHGRW